jgi:hypothetical protein
MANKSKAAAIQVQMPGVDVDLIARFGQTDSGLAGNPYAHICRVIHKRKLLTKAQLEAALWYTISDLHAAKNRNEADRSLDSAIAECQAALNQVKSLRDKTIKGAKPTPN